jgi:hypothetical protein
MADNYRQRRLSLGLPSSCEETMLAWVVLLLGAVLPGVRARDSETHVYFGSGCFWGRQKDFVDVERTLGRSDQEVTALVGYAGGPVPTRARPAAPTQTPSGSIHGNATRLTGRAGGHGTSAGGGGGVVRGLSRCTVHRTCVSRC